MSVSPHDSQAQRGAETEILKALSGQLGVVLETGSWDIGGALVSLDGVDEQRTHCVEIYACIGTLKGAQLKKVATDVLKLLLVKESVPIGGLSPLCVLVFASEAAEGSVRGWVREAIRTHDTQVRVIEPSRETQIRVREAQAAQVMVRIAQVTDGDWS